VATNYQFKFLKTPTA